MNRLGRILLCGILTVGLMAMGTETKETAKAEHNEEKGGYLAVFVAQYEYNMGVEHAQFPSGNYTDNRRTDVLHYALSRDGINYKGMNHDRAVYYPDDMKQLGSPSVFKKADGTYGMIASDNNKSSQIILSDSDDLITFSGDRVKSLNSKGIAVTDPEVEYSEKDDDYNIYWSSPEGENYVTKTTDFEIGNMKDGDVAGLTAFQNQYGYVGVKMENGKRFLVMHRAVREGDADGQEQESVELTENRVYLKVNCDFREDMKLNQTWRMKDEAYFYYSLDGNNWNQIGDTLKMSYDWPDFMGYRFGLFYFSKENCGGCVDFDYFHVSSVDGKKSELNKLLSKAENLVRTPYCTDSQWNELKEAAAKARETLPKLLDDEDELSLTQVEENNNNANVYSVISALNKAIDSVKNAKAPDTSGNADNNSQGNQGSNLGQTQAKARSPSHSGGSAASGEAVAGDNGTVSTGIAVRAAGYTLKGNTLYLQKHRVMLI